MSRSGDHEAHHIPIILPFNIYLLGTFLPDDVDSFVSSFACWYLFFFSAAPRLLFGFSAFIVFDANELFVVPFFRAISFDAVRRA